MSTDGQKYLKNLHTKQLMNLRGVLRTMGQQRDWDDDADPVNVRYQVTDTLSITHNELYAELNTREHIPSGADLKALRKQKAHDQKHR